MAVTDVYSEILLFREIAGGDQQAFRRVFDLYRSSLFSTAIKLTKSQLAAEEITQEVFISLWMSRAQLAKVENPGAYLFKMLFNKLNSYLKKESNRERIIKDAALFSQSSVNATQDVVDGNESRRRLLEAVELLPPRQKEVYQLSRLEGLKIDEIADRLHIAPTTVKTHLAKAQEAVRAHLKDLAFITALLATFRAYEDFFK